VPPPASAPDPEPEFEVEMPDEEPERAPGRQVYAPVRVDDELLNWPSDDEIDRFANGQTVRGEA
jgi:hypothetical protein